MMSLFAPFARIAAALLALLAGPGWAQTSSTMFNPEWVHAATSEQIGRQLEKGFDVNSRWERGGFTALHLVAAGNSDPDATRLLLDAGAGVNARSDLGLTPLAWAASWQPNPEVIELLIDAGAKLSAVDRYGRTALHMAASNPNPEVIELLIDAGVEVRRRNDPGVEPLQNAALGNPNPASVAAFLEAGADPNATVRNPSPKEVAAFVKAGGDPNAIRARAGIAPLHDAANMNGVAVAAVLVSAGADVNLPATDGRTPLHDAVRPGYKLEKRLRYRPAPRREMVLYLLEAGADASIRDNEGRTPADVARRSRRVDPNTIRLLERAAGLAAVSGCEGWQVGHDDRRLGDVAEKALGDRSRWPEIAALNGVTAERPHRLGQCLRLPD